MIVDTSTVRPRERIDLEIHSIDLPELLVDWVGELIARIDTALEKHLDYAFHPRFGYLTACPTNVGGEDGMHSRSTRP